MRTIKFRAWDKEESEMIYGGNIKRIIRTWSLPREKEHFDWLETLEFQQFTGLRDKNGKEIYEGDIIKDGWEENNLGQVSFSDGCFDLGIGYIESQSNQALACEVVGNIFENPELITKEKE